MDKNTKQGLSLFAFMIVTLYSMLTNFWILWAVITLMLFFDNYTESLKEWLDIRQERYIESLKKMQSSYTENTEKLDSIQKSVDIIEQRLDAVEKDRKS